MRSFELTSSSLACEVMSLPVPSASHTREPALLVGELPLFAREFALLAG
jgi:hypothetical protein